MYFERKEYLDKLTKSIGDGMIKVIVGPRRCGKSFLIFNVFKNYLLNQGVDESRIIELNLELYSNRKYRDLDEFYNFFSSRRHNDGHKDYFFIDEIQLVSSKENEFVKGEMLYFYDVLNEFLSYGNAEVFVTGSNSHMLSSDIATGFRGRGNVIKVNPLTFKEFVCGELDYSKLIEKWDEYYKYGGLPHIPTLSSYQEKEKYLSEIFNLTYLKDIADRNNLRNDYALKDITKIVGSTIGSLVNVNKISNTFLSNEKLNISVNTIKSYLNYLIEAYMISCAARYDIKGRQYIGGLYKYYFSDIGIRNAATNFREYNDEAHIIENVVYNELVTRGFNVNIGVVDQAQILNGKYTISRYEVDFIAEKGGPKFYLQVALSIDDEEKMKQEKRSLLRIKDSFIKIIITKYSTGVSYDNDGIIHIGLFDFLLKPEILEDLSKK